MSKEKTTITGGGKKGQDVIGFELKEMDIVVDIATFIIYF